MKIVKIDTDGHKGTLTRGEFGLDLSVDKDKKEYARVYVGDGEDNIPLSKLDDVKDVQKQVDDLAYILALNLA